MLTEKEPFFPSLLDNRTFFQKLKRRYNSTIERKTDFDTYHDKSFVVQRKELLLRTLEPKKQYVAKRPKTIVMKENIPMQPSFSKLVQAFVQMSNPEKNSKIKKQTLKIITQHQELDALEEEHRCKIESIKGRFFTEVQSYLKECHRF